MNRPFTCWLLGQGGVWTASAQCTHVVFTWTSIISAQMSYETSPQRKSFSLYQLLYSAVNFERL